MKRALIIFILCNCFFLSVFAQQNLLGKQLTQLKKVALQQHNLHKTHSYIDTLNKISYLYLKENSDSSWAYATKAYNLSVKENYLIGQARAKLNFSVNNYYKGEFERSTRELNEAYQISIKTTNQSLIASCLNNLGLAYIQQKNYTIALKHFYRSLELSTRIKDYNIKMLSHFNLGFCNALLFGKYKKTSILNLLLNTISLHKT